MLLQRWSFPFVAVRNIRYKLFAAKVYRKQR